MYVNKKCFKIKLWYITINLKLKNLIIYINGQSICKYSEFFIYE